VMLTETIGGIIDKLSILEKRKEAIKDQGDKEVPGGLILLNNLDKQRAWFIYEIGRVINDVFNDKRPSRFEKNKIYDKDIKGEYTDNFIEAITNLDKHNRMLWDLENTRRDKTADDSSRLFAADQISIENKMRNDCIDRIDAIVEEAYYLIHKKT